MIQELLTEKERILYEDDVVAAVLVKNAAIKGHIKIIPKTPVKSIEELSEDELERIFYTASYAATLLFETIGAQGTNIITNEDDGFSMDVIARMPDDGLDFQWEPKQLPTSDLDSALSGIKGSILVPGDEKDEEVSNPPPMPDQPEDIITDQEDNYLIKQIIRIP